MNDVIEVTYLPVWRRYEEMFRDAGLTNLQLGKLLRLMRRISFTARSLNRCPGGSM